MRGSPQGRDRLITWLARLLVRCFYRSVETEGTLPPTGPVILAASHLNGFVDPVVLVAELRAFPRYLAKATLWDVKVAKPLLNFARVIPVHRRQDGATTGNVGTFDSAVQALADGSLLAVFPEGTTHDDPTIRPLRTGVARIALQASASGVAGVTIVPVGVTYEDKVAVRGRALVSFGEPIAVPDASHALDESGEPSHEIVHQLTDRLTVALQALTPHFSSTEEALALTAAAEISLRTQEDPEPVRMADVAAKSRRLSRAGADPVRELVSLVARYQMLLGFVGLEDEDLVHRVGLKTLARRLVVLGVLLVVLAPVALAGLFANLIPVVLVLIAGLTVKAPVTKGTVRLLVAVVAFPAMWLALAITDGSDGWLGQTARQVTYPVDLGLGRSITDRSGAAAGIVVFIAAPLLGAIALVLAQRLVAFIRSLESWRTLLDRRGQLADVRARRADVVDATADLLRPAPAPSTST